MVVNESGMQHTHTKATLLPHHVMDGSGLFTAVRSELAAQRRELLVERHAATPGCYLLHSEGLAGDEETRMPREKQRCGGRTHMLNATYIWYSSIASTNCPHESKSVPFSKLACHF